jgi:hypothetical protein
MRFSWPAVGAAALVFVVLAAGCGQSSTKDVTGSRGVDEGGTVRVARSDVTAVVTLDGVVVPTPVATVDAPRAGAVQYSRRLKTGQIVGPRTKPLFRIGDRWVHAVVRSNFEGWLVPRRSKVPRGLPVARIRYVGFGIEAATPPDLAYRIFSRHISAKGEIRDGPAAFSCPVLNPAALPSLPDPNANQGNSGSAGSGPSIICAVPRSVYAVSGLRAFVAIRSAIARNVLTLPVGAVAGTAERGAVWLIDKHGVAHEHDVRLGVTDGAVVEIKSGLRLGDRIGAVAPDRANYR